MVQIQLFASSYDVPIIIKNPMITTPSFILEILDLSFYKSITLLPIRFAECLKNKSEKNHHHTSDNIIKQVRDISK